MNTRKTKLEEIEDKIQDLMDAEISMKNRLQVLRKRIEEKEEVAARIFFLKEEGLPPDSSDKEVIEHLRNKNPNNEVDCEHVDIPFIITSRWVYRKARKKNNSERPDIDTPYEDNQAEQEE